MIEIVLVGSIARHGAPVLEKHLRAPHRLVNYPCDLAGTEVLVGSPVSRQMIEQAPKLRLVHLSGAGYDNVDFGALPPQVRVCNVFHHERAMAEYVILTMLALQRDLLGQDRRLRQGRWDGSCVTGPPRVAELSGRKLGLIGYGHIGREIARLASPFELEVLALRSGHRRAEREALLACVDYLVIACPLTAATRGMIGAAELALMRPGASLINVARGEIVDERALYEALRDRRIRSAAIDVWYRYPRGSDPCLPSAYPFHSLENVILTPHGSGWTDRVVERRFRDIARNVDRLAAGEPLENLVAP